MHAGTTIAAGGARTARCRHAISRHPHLPSLRACTRPSLCACIWQSIISWFRIQGYTSLPNPTHYEIQKTLVDHCGQACDLPPSPPALPMCMHLKRPSSITAGRHAISRHLHLPSPCACTSEDPCRSLAVGSHRAAGKEDVAGLSGPWLLSRVCGRGHVPHRGLQQRRRRCQWRAPPRAPLRDPGHAGEDHANSHHTFNHHHIHNPR